MDVRGLYLNLVLSTASILFATSVVLVCSALAQAETLVSPSPEEVAAGDPEIGYRNQADESSSRTESVESGSISRELVAFRVFFTGLLLLLLGGFVPAMMGLNYGLQSAFFGPAKARWDGWVVAWMLLRLVDFLASYFVVGCFVGAAMQFWFPLQPEESSPMGGTTETPAISVAPVVVPSRSDAPGTFAQTSPESKRIPTV